MNTPATDEGARHDLLRDAVCVLTLLKAADARAAGDDAEGLLGESIAVLSANIWHACWHAPSETYPADVLHAAGQLGALASSRNSVLHEAMSAPDDRHSFLVDQVGWLDTLAQETAGRLIGALRDMPAPGSDRCGEV